MANSYESGRIYLDTASSQVVAVDRRLKINYVMFVPDASNDQILVRENANGPIVFKFSAAQAKQQQLLDFSRSPILMNGVYVDSISTGAIAILYTTSKGVS